MRAILCSRDCPEVLRAGPAIFLVSWLVIDKQRGEKGSMERRGGQGSMAHQSVLHQQDQVFVI